MELTPHERAKLVVRYLAKKAGTKQEEIGKRLGYNNKSAFSALLNGSRIIPKNFFDKLIALDPEINPAFLAGETNEILLPQYQQPTIPEIVAHQARQQEKQQGIFLPNEMVQMFTDLSATIRSQQETIRQLVGEKADAAKVG